MNRAFQDVGEVKQGFKVPPAALFVAQGAHPLSGSTASALPKAAYVLPSEGPTRPGMSASIPQPAPFVT